MSENEIKNVHPHVPIMVRDILSYLPKKESPTDPFIYIDGTVGYGGHSSEIIKSIDSKSSLIGIDQDDNAISYCRNRFSEEPRCEIVKGNFSEISTILESKSIPHFNFLLLDLGISSFHLDSSEKGFTHQKDEPLDMRMNDSLELTAKIILDTYSDDELTQVFQNFGELRRVEKFVETIIAQRGKLETTFDLITSIKKSFYFRNKRSVYLRTCAQVFQALRIEVNQELHHIKHILSQLDAITVPGSTIAIISFHSLEDRIIKQFIRTHSDTFIACHKKVLTASQNEIKRNSRSRSAKLRVFSKINPDDIPEKRKGNKYKKRRSKDNISVPDSII
ncbi:16S rRNA (cytosine(1402)-N(4))-methyltransferase RsmH [bacterium]|jgi:16S rRNA (cytosine1402-N4)-methyltransferase|nr:16S rRNA (cytosine(1402)-N(4))-methyltransferase RsmH [bacterium]